MELKGNILITGSGGQLGSELRALLGERPNIFYTDVKELDITKSEQVERFLFEKSIDIIVNCAAYTAVDRAEEEEDVALRVNRDAPENLAKGALAVWRAGSSGKGGPLLIHISTDYVFDGKGHRPYTENSLTAPVSAYGRTKLAGEKAILDSGCNAIIIRTSWLYSAYGTNFVKTITRLASEREKLDVVFDQVGTPTYAGDLAKVIGNIISAWELAEPSSLKSLPGVYHFSNEGVCSWYDFAKEIVKQSRRAEIQTVTKDCRINPVTSDKFVTKAVRPAYSVLDKGKIKSTFGIEIRHWREPLEDENFWRAISVDSDAKTTQS
ncbi:MAG: dTDP-4-dehydrorhamnose reductase [Bacteroidetes bacterium 41-46]|nr:MAG: dTDP-4-dehydrorhamnose reductase [Bacteroidetes bacterium 41-46]